MARENMIPTVLNTNFERLAELDDYISFIWTERFYKPGDFEICIDIKHSQNLQIGYYIQRKKDDHIGVIEKIQYQRTEEAQEIIIVSGRLIQSILARRVISTQTQITGRVTAAIGMLINENVMNPVNAARKISNVTFTNNSVSTATMDAQYTGENLLETINSLCETYSVGIDCVLDAHNNFAFSLYDGVDRSYNQSANPYIVFSEDYDNLLTSEYDENYENYVTDVLVGGEGEGINRTMIWSSKAPKSGLSRYETFLDASTAVTNEQIITQETYEKQLEGLGYELVTDYTAAFSGEVDFTGVRYGTDLDLGDIVTIENKRWGMLLNSRLIEVIESIGEDGAYSVVPTFGT